MNLTKKTLHRFATIAGDGAYALLFYVLPTTMLLGGEGNQNKVFLENGLKYPKLAICEAQKAEKDLKEKDSPSFSELSLSSEIASNAIYQPAIEQTAYYLSILGYLQPFSDKLSGPLLGSFSSCHQNLNEESILELESHRSKVFFDFQDLGQHYLRSLIRAALSIGTPLKLLKNLQREDATIVYKLHYFFKKSKKLPVITTDNPVQFQNLLEEHIDRLIFDDLKLFTKLKELLVPLLETEIKKLRKHKKAVCQLSASEIIKSKNALRAYVIRNRFTLKQEIAAAICYHKPSQKPGVLNALREHASTGGHVLFWSATLLPASGLTLPISILSAALISGKFLENIHYVENDRRILALQGASTPSKELGARLEQSINALAFPLGILSLSYFNHVVQSAGAAKFFVSPIKSEEAFLLWLYGNVVSTIVGAQKSVEAGVLPWKNTAYIVDQIGNFVAYTSVAHLIDGIKIFKNISNPIVIRFLQGLFASGVFIGIDDLIQSIKASIDPTYERDPRISVYYVAWSLTMFQLKFLALNQISKLKDLAAHSAYFLFEYGYFSVGYGSLFRLLGDPEGKFWPAVKDSIRPSTFNFFSNEFRENWQELTKK